MAQEEAARIARKLAELDAQSTTITKERKLLDGEHSAALERIEDARADLKEQRSIAHVHGSARSPVQVHHVVNVPASVVRFAEVDPDDIPMVDGSAPREVVSNCGVGGGCMGADEGDEGDEADEPDEGALTPRDEAAEEKEAEAAREHARSRALSPLSQALGFRIPGLDDARHTGDI